MSDRPFAYVCSPLRGDTEANMARAREYSHQVFEAGYNPVCPQIFYTQFLRDDIPEERAAGMDMGMALLPMCRALVICGDDITEGMRQEVIRAKEIGIEVCSLENIPRVPTLKNYRDDLDGLANIEIAVSLIESMTGCRFKTWTGGVFICPDNGACLSVNMRNTLDIGAGLHHITFDAGLRTMGYSLNAEDVLKLGREIERTRTLLSLLESRKFILTPDEMEAFYNSIYQRDAGITADTPAKQEEKPSVREQIAAARAAPESSPKRGRKHQSHEEER